jgi:hypothetical protein
MGHSTVRVTQDLSISADGDLYERYLIATEQGASGEGGAGRPEP